MNSIMLNTTLAFVGSFGWGEMLVLALLGVLIFGKRLPEVGRSVGRSIVEFKKGLAGIDEEIGQGTHQPPRIERHMPAEAASVGRNTPTEETGQSLADQNQTQVPST